MPARNDRVDVVNGAYIAGNITVGTTQVLAAVGIANLADRQELNIYNSSSARIWIGPSGVAVGTGIPLDPDEVVTWQYGPDLQVYLIAGTAGNTIHIQESA